MESTYRTQMDAPRPGPSRSTVASFVYHEATDDPTDSGFQRPAAFPFKHTRRAFAEHLGQIATAGRAPELILDVDLTQQGRHLVLTFDDGGKSALHISEELSARGWKGHFFVVTSLIGTRTFLTASEIRSIRSCGHLIGSHSHTHPDIFREQTRQQMAAEWRVSCDTLADVLGEPCVTASVPGGDISPLVLRSADCAGLSHLFTSEPELVPRRVGDCWVLGRFGPKVSTPPAQIRDLVHFRGWRRALAIRRLKVLARRTLPPVYRAYVRTRTRGSRGSAA
jgi:peptidoglycan/xylan/chitin deacetylase (PgdA/CDA1 family)